MLHLLFIAQDAAHAAGHGPPHTELIQTGNWLPAVTALVVFLIVFAFLYVKVWPQIVKGLDDREQKIRDEIAAAEASREQAKAALAEYERNLSQARQEANAMIVKAKADAKAVAEELRSRNQTELSEMKQRAMREIEVAKQTAISSIYNEASNLAVSIAGKILEREITSRDQQHLVDQSLRELAKAGRG